MTGSVDKAKVVLKKVRIKIDKAQMLGDTSAAKVCLLTIIVSELCDVLTMLVGEAVEVPHDLASDADYRCRLMDVIDRMNDLDRYAVMTATGAGLDEIGRHVGIPR